MISEAVEFRDFDGTRYANLERLFRGDLESDAAKSAESTGFRGLLVLTKEARVVKIWHTQRGRLDPLEGQEMASIADMAARHDVRWVVRADVSALEEVNEAASASLEVGHDMVDLVLAVFAALAEQVEAGRVAIWPNIFQGVRLPSRANLRRFADTVLPPYTTFLLYIFDGRALWAEIICVRGEREISLIAGHDALECGPPPLRWRDDHKVILEAASKRLGTPSLGIFLSLDAARDILSGSGGGGTLSRALARRELIFDPLPSWLAGPLGVLALREAVQAGRKAGERLAESVSHKGRRVGLAGRVAGKMAGKVTHSIGERLRQAVPLDRVEQTVSRVKKKADLGEILGFDPFVLFGNLLELSRRPPGTRVGSTTDNAEDEGRLRHD